MAKLDSTFGFTGTIGDFTAYRVPGVDGIIIRRRGGVSANEIRFSARFANTRRVNAEFGGRSTCTRYIMRLLRPVADLADYRFSGALNALLRPIQTSDKISPYGQRHVLLSQNRGALDGFSLNESRTFDKILRAPVLATISRADLSAEVHLPELGSRFNFFPPSTASHFRFILSFGIVPDLFHSEGKYIPSSKDYDGFSPVMTNTPWHHTAKGSAPEKLNLVLDTTPPDEQFSLLLAIGIQFGKAIGPDEIEPVKKVGTARIFGVG